VYTLCALLLLPEVGPARQFSHDEHVDALDHLALEGRGAEQRGQGLDGPQVGERPQMLSQLQQPGFGAHGGVVEVRVADRAEQDRVRGEGGLERLLRDGFALFADGRATDPAFPVAYLDAEVLGRGVYDLARGPDHLRSDAVAGEQQYLERASQSVSS
jgi:hypothetical protein